MDRFGTFPKRRRQTIHGDEINREKVTRRKMSADYNLPSGSESFRRALMRRDMPTSIAALHSTLKTELRRRVSSKVLKHKLNKLQDYSLPEQFTAESNFDLLRKSGEKENTADAGKPGTSRNEEKMDTSLEEIWVPRATPPRKASRIALRAIADMITPTRSPQTSTRKGQKFARKAFASKDTDLQQRIDHEIKMREGTTKLLAACQHPPQILEAARSLLCSNTRIIAYMTELQKRKTQEVLGQTQSTEGNQLPCRAQISVSDIRIPLMWKDTDHFKNKGDYRQYAVFCLLKVGTDIFDTSMITDVDRSMTDITFEDVILFHDIPHNFELKLEVYCHKLHEELSVANTPRKIRKKITDLSGSVGRNVGKRLSGLSDADVIGSMLLGPRFELVAWGTLQLQDVNDSVGIFDFELEKNSEGRVHELPLFGNYCCRVAAVPDCLTKPVVSGYLNVQDDSDRSRWHHYWCVLKNLQLACWLSAADTEHSQPVVSIPITKNTQISDANPGTSKSAHTFLIKTVSLEGTSQHTLAAESAEEVNKWWDGFQQHLLDQALWKHACDEVMDIRSPTKNKVNFLKKSTLYDDISLTEPEATSTVTARDLNMEDDPLSQMLSTLTNDGTSQMDCTSSHSGATS